MLAPRSMIGRSLAGLYLAAVCIVSLSTSFVQIEERKCACTSKACKEAGVDTCRTKFFCYTESLPMVGEAGDKSTTTRGCTEGATPLLCETKSWITRSQAVDDAAAVATVEPLTIPWLRVPWPRLKCCNSHDYCNADDSGSEGAGAWTRERKTMDLARSAATESAGSKTPGGVAPAEGRDETSMTRFDCKREDSLPTDRHLRHRVKALHVAALVLAVAALISVLASCYVVTRFLRNDRYVTTRCKLAVSRTPSFTSPHCDSAGYDRGLPVG